MFTATHSPGIPYVAVGVQTYRGRAMAERPSRSDAKRELQARQRDWLQEVITATQLRPSQIATQAGVSDTTLTRLLNNPDHTGVLTQITIDRIKGTFKVPGPEEYSGLRGTMLGFAEAERYEAKHAAPDLARVVEMLVGGRNGVDAWRLKTDALALVGYLPDDLLLVDLHAEPKPQDAVLAQVYDWKGGSTQSVFRIFDPPFLVAASHDRTAFKPLLADNDRVIIRGVVIESFRARRLSASR